MLLTDVWHVFSRLGEALIFNPPSLPEWATWFTLIIRTVVVLVIFRRNVAPFLLARISRRVRARSISLLSIKGLYFHSTGRIWRVERIGWSLHPWAESRISVKVEGLRVEITKPQLPIRRKHRRHSQSTARRLVAPLSMIQEAIMSLERLLDWLSLSSLFAWLRILVSTISIFTARSFIRCLPSLTQNVDFELDSVIISFEALLGTRVIFRGVTLSTKIDFSQMDNEAEASMLAARRLGVEGERTPTQLWSSMFRNGADRFWERIWGQTEGFAAVTVAVREIVGHKGSTHPTFLSRPGSHPTDGGSTPYSRLPSDVFLHVAGHLRISISSQFSPKLLTLQRYGLDCSIDIPTIDVSFNGVRSLLDLISQSDPPEVLSLENIQHWSPPHASPVVVSPISPTSPFMSAFSHIAGKRGSTSSPVPSVQRLREPKVQPLITVLKSIDIRLPSIRCFQDSESYLNASGSGRRTYLYNLKGFILRLGLSNASSNNLHRKWLGSGVHSALDGVVYGITWNVGLVSVTRLLSDVTSPVQMVALHELRVDFLAHGWPQMQALMPKFLYGDPNGPFIACEVSITGFHVTERVEELRMGIDSVVPATGTSTPKSIPVLLFYVPRVELCFTCDDIQAHLTACDEGSVHARQMLVYRTPGVHVSLSTAFRTGAGMTVREAPSVSDQSGLQMDMSCHVLLQPTFIHAGLADILEDNSGIGLGYRPEEPDPLLGIDGVELLITSSTLCHFGVSDTVVLESQTSLAEIKCMADVVSVNLWKAESVTATRVFLDAVIRNPRVQAQTSPPPEPLNFSAAISAHFAIGTLTCVATGLDLNPSCDLELSRGLEVQSGISLQYCYLGASHSFQPIKTRFAQARGREQLDLPADLSIQAIAAASADGEYDVLALYQSSTWQTTCRSIVSTSFEFGADHGVHDATENRLIYIPQTVTKARRRRQKYTHSMFNGMSKETCDVSMNVPHLSGRLDLLNAYSVLLASRTLLQVFSRHSDAEIVPGNPDMWTTFRLRLGNAHIYVYFPLHERMFIRVLSASLETSLGTALNFKSSSAVAWVSSPRVQGTWEELLRVCGAHISVTGTSPVVKVKVVADGLRIAIPHCYVLSELILDMGIAAKALRHVRRIVQQEHYVSLQSPAAEAPKHLPIIDILIRSTTLEAADSPFEAKLGLIWRTGYQAQKVRIERELAFEAKLRAILASGDSVAHIDPKSQSDLRYHFTSKHTTSVVDARNRLNMVHSNSWISSISRQKDEIARREDMILRQLRYVSDSARLHVPIPIVVHTPEKAPPLFRAVISGSSMSLAPPTFPAGHEGFLEELGGMPRSTEYSLLVSMHMRCSFDAAMLNIRDYPLPLFNVPSHANSPSLSFVTNLIIAEEIGSGDSVEWLQCPIVPRDAGIVGAGAFLIQVPKTIMPVKSYASPNITFCTTAVTEFTWGVSYNPAIQEVMRVIETLSHPPHDPSPAIGFWDKLRLVFHWRINANFIGGAHLHFKGSRDPYHTLGVGAGFDFRWDGNVTIKVGHANEANELIQLHSDSMVITIPNHGTAHEGDVMDDSSSPYWEYRDLPHSPQISMSDRKICAKFSNGIRWGIGLALERTCDAGCKTCHGDTFSRGCRFFTFVPHYKVVLRSTSKTYPDVRDSYAGFRSNFIHFSTSLTSPLKPGGGAKLNSFHLTPRTFAHFWSWWHLFDSALSLPIRQGSLFPDSRPPSKKFGRHLATIKYRITFSPLYIAHVYKIDSGEAWTAGQSHCVGVKAFLEHFQADMHQREEETFVTSGEGSGPKIIRHKPFSAVDVVITGLDLRALFAVFAEPLKKSIPLKKSLPGSTRFWESFETTPLSSTWVDTDDFVEIDWLPVDKEPDLYFHDAAHCPRFVYFKRTTRTESTQDKEGTGWSTTKFGDEDTHRCLMGKEPSAHEVQLGFGTDRLAELRARLADSLRVHETVDIDPRLSDHKPFPAHPGDATRETSITQMITLLERYTQRLSNLRASSSSGPREAGHKVFDDIYDMPTDIKLPQELGEFANVYQVHCPKIHLNNATRDILQKYYIASRSRRGFEYHMSARAVKFIRDQAHTARAEPSDDNPKKRRPRAGSAHAAAQAVRRILTGDERHKAGETQHIQSPTHNMTDSDPLYGWDQGVSERKAHLCLLLKPQIVMRSERSTRSVLVFAADHVVLRNYGILDKLNADDPVSGYVMQRNYADINSLQVFQPVAGASADHLPLEVFLDFRCESRDFDRLVPQTDALLRYDKFNRLRLRNNIATVATSARTGDLDMIDHLLHEMDLIAIQVPRFTITADASAFASMADVVTDLLLFSDPVHKARMTQLETMLFSYDFADLPSAAKVVADLQSRIRRLIRMEGAYALKTDLSATEGRDLLAGKAHILTLSQELNLIFDAIRLAQDITDDRNQEKKSALRLQVSSSDISWQMLDENRELLAKLAVRGINYSWLSRQDGSTTSVLLVVDLQAFDGSPNALWPEILAKHDDPSTHRMVRRGLFAEAQWSVLAPVGGISIYDHFELELHPIRLALETQLGNKLVDYLIPGRRFRREATPPVLTMVGPPPSHSSHLNTSLAVGSLDAVIPSSLQLTVHPPHDTGSAFSGALTPQTTQRRARPTASRSFSNLRSIAAESRNKGYHAPGLPKSSSSTALVQRRCSVSSDDDRKSGLAHGSGTSQNKADDASEMRQRSAQKTFVHVKIPSVHVLLSVMKGRGFLVRDARLRTHDLEWRNRTSSFEELINQFIPSDPSLRGWVKVAWQQPVFSVGGVVKELITKTQWGKLGKSPETGSPLRRRSDGHPSEDGRPRNSPESSPEGGHLFPSQASENGARIARRQPRQRSTSRPRVGSLFRRPGTPKSSIDSVGAAAIAK